MSSNLYWMPPPEEIQGECIDLKYELGRYFDKEYNGGNIDEIVDKNIVPYLQGIIVASRDHSVIESSKTLINAIEKYGKVQIITRW